MVVLVLLQVFGGFETLIVLKGRSQRHIRVEVNAAELSQGDGIAQVGSFFLLTSSVLGDDKLKVLDLVVELDWPWDYLTFLRELVLEVFNGLSNFRHLAAKPIKVNLVVMRLECDIDELIFI